MATPSQSTLLAEKGPPRIRLPQEVIDQIIDHCHQNIPTLRTLALVSRSWLASARYHIFENVMVKSKHKSLSSFIFLQKSGPSICLSVRCLTIHHVEINTAEYISAFRELPQLRNLLLYYANIHQTPTTIPNPPSLPLRRKLQILRFYACQVHGQPNPIFDIIKQFDTISELIVTEISFGQSACDSVAAPIPSQCGSETTRVDALVYHRNNIISSCDELSMQLAKNLVNAISGRSLSSITVELSPQHPNEHERYALLIPAASQNLRNLTIEVEALMDADPSTPRLPAIRPLLDLSSCQALETIAFQFVIYTQYQAWTDSLDIISSLPPSSSLSRITVSFLVADGITPDVKIAAVFQDVAWQRLQSNLRGLSSLQTVKFVFSHAWLADWSIAASAVEFIRAELFGLASPYNVEIVSL